MTPRHPARVAAPVSWSERIELLDALRGFALLGILTVNLCAYAGWDDVMALTNYLAQPLVAMLLFTGVGLGLMDPFNVARTPSLALAIFTAQAALSATWLGCFCARQPMRRTAVATAVAPRST